MHRNCLIFCLLLLSATRLLSADQEIYPSPNGELAIATAPSAASNRFKVQLLDTATRHVLASYDPEARAIEVLWSPDGRFVAINEDFSHATNNLSIWHLIDRRWEPVHLPQRLRAHFVIDDPKTQIGHTQEAITRLIPKDVAPLIKFWYGGHEPHADRWHNRSNLQISVGGEAELRDDRHLIVEHRFMVHCSRDCTARIEEEKQIKYEATTTRN